MANEIFDLKSGLKARLENIPGLRVITFEPQDWRDFPVAVIRTESRSASRVDMSGSRFDAEFVATVMPGGANRREAYDALDAYIAPDGAMSLEAAIAADRTLGGAADWTHPPDVQNIRVVRIGSGRYLAADFRVRVERRAGDKPILELKYGSDVIDLTGEPYHATGDVRFSNVEDSLPGDSDHIELRMVEIELRMRESAAGQVRDGLNKLNSMCAMSERRTGAAWDSSVRLRHGRASSPIEYRTLRGGVAPVSADSDPGFSAKLMLVVEALGRMAQVETARTLQNEQQGANLNYADTAALPGAHAALAQIEIRDPSGAWSDERKMWIGVKSGEDRDANLFFQGEDGSIAQGETMFEDMDGTWSSGVHPLSTASGGRCARMSWTMAGRYATRAEFTLCGYVRVALDAPNVPVGRFRALARVRTDSDNPELGADRMGFALGWKSGAVSHIPTRADAVFPQTQSEFRTLDLGELTLPTSPTPEGYSTPALDIDIHGVFAGADIGSVTGTHHFRWSVDYLALLPIDEGEAVVDAVGTTTAILIQTPTGSGQSVHLLDGSDTILGPAQFRGTPIRIAPEGARIYVARDDSADPSAVKFGMKILLTPLAAGL